MADIRIDPSSGRKVLRAPTVKKVQPKVDFVSGGNNAEVFYSMAGLQAMIENIGLLPKLYKDAAGYELANIAADIIIDSRENYVPYMNGVLRDSAGSDEYVPAAENFAEIGMWYAAPGGHVGMGSKGRQIGKSTKAGAAREMGLHEENPTLYAAIQHEDPTFKHPVLGPVSMPQDKYLEKPFNKMVPNMMPRITAAVEEAGGSFQ